MAETWFRKVSRLVFGEDGSILFDDEMEIVAVSSFIAVSGIFLVSPIFSDLTSVFQVSDSRVGQLMTVFTAPTIVVAPLFGLLSDRIGRKPILTGGLVLFGAAGSAVALTNSFEIALGLRMAQGVGFAATMLVGVTILGDRYRGTEEVTAQGIRFVSIQTATLGLPLIAGILILSSWRYPFALFAGGILAGAWAWLALPEMTTTTADISVRNYFRNLLGLISHPVMALVIASFTLRFLLSGGFFTYISVLMRDLTPSPTLYSGVAIAMFGLVALVSGSQIGRITSDRQPLIVLVYGFLLSTVGLGLMGATGSLTVAFLGVCVFAVSTGLTAPVQKSFVNAFASRELRGGAVSSSMLFQMLGNTLGPIVFGAFIAVIAPSETFIVAGGGVAILGAVACGIAYILAERSGDRSFGTLSEGG